MNQKKGRPGGLWGGPVGRPLTNTGHAHWDEMGPKTTLLQWGARLAMRRDRQGCSASGNAPRPTRAGAKGDPNTAARPEDLGRVGGTDTHTGMLPGISRKRNVR